jgi:hypothetical protein
MINLKLPLLPSPQVDETFGSWIFRAAASYHTTPREFARAIAPAEHHSALYECDFDTQPPATLLDALATHSIFRRSELERLIVHPTPSTLAPFHRDAYCPDCMREDRERGSIYFRRAWLDAWALHCERHQCLLGRFEPLEYRAAEQATAHKPFPRTPEPFRRNPSVIPVRLPHLRGRPFMRRELSSSVLADALRHIAGRDLVLIMGSQNANAVVYRLTGIARQWNAVWHRQDRLPVLLSQIEHPQGGIELRVSALILASLVRQFVWGKSPITQEHEQLASSTAALIAPFLHRWPRADRLRFILA